MKSKLAKILCIALALVMVVGIAACGPTDDSPDASPTPPGGNEPGGNEPGGTEPSGPSILTVAYGAPSTGEFIGGWGNSAYDVTIQNLLHGDVGTVAVTPTSEIIINETIVKSFTVSDDADGNRTYVFEINDNLLWSDGTSITAEDFVAGALFVRSPAWTAVGASSSSYTELIGATEYGGGIPEMSEEPDDWDDEDGVNPYEPEQIGWIVEPSDYFAGVRLLGEYELSITIDGEELPYFFELLFASISPIPLHVWAPGVSVVTNANGSRFDADILEHATHVSETERFAPSATAGPYKFVSFEDDIVTVELNPNFSGNAFGEKPTIDFIQQISVQDEVAVDSLFSGVLNLYPAEIRGANIERVMAEPGFSTHAFDRDGYGVMNLVHDWGPLQDVNVRWALAHLVDRQAVLDQVLGGFGGLIDTHASEAQWMFKARRAEVIAAIRPIALNVSEANRLLDLSEWKFEEDGTTPFDASQANADGTYLRHNAAGEPLIVRNGAANEEIGNVIEMETVRTAALAGMEFRSEFLEWATVLEHFYYVASLPEEERLYSTFSMGSDNGVPFDPYWYWHTDILGTWMNPSFSDPKLDDLIIAMRTTEPGDLATYLEAWFDYVVRWNELLPALPLYANRRVDLFSDKVSGIENVTPFANWANPHIITKLSVSG
jgi:peptide/nickel transport system substrate-binding protein